MKTLLCKIGTQGLSDGRHIQRGETYEVDDKTASTLVAAGYAEEVVSDPVHDAVVVDVTEAVSSDDADAEVDAPVVEDVVVDEPDGEVPDESDADIASVAEDAIAAAESADSVPPAKKKRTYKRRT